jgi:hypothetical protein
MAAKAKMRALATVVGCAAVCLGVSCGPEAYRGGVDAAAGQSGSGGNPGTGGAATDGGTAGADGTADGMADVPADGMAATDGGGSDVAICSVRGDGGGGDAGLPTFSTSWTFDGPGGLQGWLPGGQPADVVAGSTAVLDSQDGFPSPGSVRFTIPFNAAAQQIVLALNFPAPMDFTGKVMSARVRLNSCNSAGTVLVGLAFKSIAGVYLYAASAVPALVASDGWVTLNLDFGAPNGFIDTSHKDADGGTLLPDPKTVLELNIIVLTANPPYATADLSIDTIGLSDRPAAAQDAAQGAPDSGGAANDGAGADSSDAAGD